MINTYKFKIQCGWDGRNEFDGFVLIKFVPDPEIGAGMSKKWEKYYETYAALPQVGKALSWYDHIKYLTSTSCENIEDKLAHAKKMFFEQASGIEHDIPDEVEFVKLADAEKIKQEVSARVKWLFEVGS